MRLACLKAMASTTGRKREPVTKTGSRRLAAPPPDAANQSVLACEGAEALAHPEFGAEVAYYAQPEVMLMAA
jgi:hypothetical protein